MPKRTYSREFKESAVKLVYEQGYAPGEAAKSLGVDLLKMLLSGLMTAVHEEPRGGERASLV